MFQKITKKIKENIILLIGIAIRVVMPFFAYDIPQHDVWGRSGHFDYAFYIMKNLSLPDSNYYEFHQPPLNAIIQAIFTKVCTLFSKNDMKVVYGYSIFLASIYSIITLIVVKKILDEFNIKKLAKNIVLLIMSVYPGIIIMGIQLGNDGLSMLFFYLSLYLAIVWYKETSVNKIICLAISIGLGMLTKVSVGLIAFIIGPMMIYKLFYDKKILKQLLVFSVIVFPLGLCYEIRNLVLFNQMPGTIFEIGKNHELYIDNNTYGFIDRFLSFPIDRLFHKKAYIYHHYNEYNVWIDLLKTSTFDEIGTRFDFTDRNIIIDTMIYILNIVFYVFSIVAIFVNLIKKVSFIKIIAYGLLVIAIVAYIGFNIRYPYSCNSNWRYIPYITFSQIILISLLFNH